MFFFKSNQQQQCINIVKRKVTMIAGWTVFAKDKSHICWWNSWLCVTLADAIIYCVRTDLIDHLDHTVYVNRVAFLRKYYISRKRRDNSFFKLLENCIHNNINNIGIIIIICYIIRITKIYINDKFILIHFIITVK